MIQDVNQFRYRIETKGYAEVYKEMQKEKQNAIKEALE